MAGKGRERKEPKNTRNRPEAKNCRILSTSFARFLQLWPKRGGHFRFAYYELKEAVGTSFRLVHERHHHGLLAVADEKRPTRRMVSPSDPLAMVALGHKAMLGNKWCLGCTFITWSMRSRNDDLDCEACLWPRWMRSSCRFRKGSRVRDEKQEKKRKKEKKKKKKKENAGDKGSESVSFQWNVALSRRKKIRGEQEWVGWDYFAYFARYSFRRFAFVDKCFFTDYLGYAIFPDG